MARVTMVLDTDGCLFEVRGESATARPVPMEVAARTLRDGLGPHVPAETGIILLTGGMGAIEEELVHRALTPLGPVRPVSRVAAAVSAVLRLGEAEGLHLVCDAGDRAFTVGLVEVGEESIRLLSITSEPGLGGQAFVEAVSATSAPQARAEVGRALAGRDGRLAAVLEQARRHDFVRGEPVAPGISAGLVLDTYTAFAERMRARLTACPGAKILLIGGFADFPLVPATIRDGVGREPRRLDADSIARGACDVAEGRTRLILMPQDSVTLPMHRIHDGLLQEAAVSLPAELGEFAQLDGRPLVLSRGSSLPDPLPLVVRGERHDVSLARLAPGDYRIGVRGAPFGLLFDGTAAGPVLIPVEGQA